MTFGYMIYRFFHDRKYYDEWLLVEKMPAGNYKAICTRSTKIYELGCVRTFFFDDKTIWKKGRLRPNNHSLTNNKKYDGKSRDVNWEGW